MGASNVKTVGEWIGAHWQRTTAWEEAVFAGAVMKLLGVMMGYDVDPTTE